MKITDVACHILQCKVDKPFVSARGWVYGTRSSCVVEISTDEGITGWGECYGPSAVAKTFIETQFKARVVGRDPFDVEAIWEDLYNRIKDYGTTGMAISAISGIDIALWDIMGRSVNKPVHKLIGGAYRSEVVPYATGLYFIDMDRLVEEAVEEALGYAEQGFRAIKMKIGLGDLKLDAKRVGAEAVVLELQCLLHGFLDQPIHVDEIEAGGVGLHLPTVGAADQLVDRPAGGPAHDVPQRDVDARERRDGEALRAVVLDAVVEVLPHHLHVEGVAAEDARGVLRLDQRLVHRGRAIALAPAGDAHIRRHLDDARAAGGVEPAAGRGEGPLHLGLQQVAGDARHLHGVPSPECLPGRLPWVPGGGKRGAARATRATP